MYIYIFSLFVSLLFAWLLTEYSAGRIQPLAGSKTVTRFAPLALAAGAMSPFFLLAAVRYDVGVDYFFTYVPMFEKIAGGASMAQVGTEPLFYLLNKIISVTGGGTVWLFTITSLIITGLFFAGMYQQSDNFLYSVVMFFVLETYFISLAYVRQFIALAIVFYALKYLYDRQWYKYLLRVGLACMFHTSAVMMRPLALLRYLPLHPAALAGIVAALSRCKGLITGIFEYIVSFTEYDKYIDSVYQAASRFYIQKFIMYLLVFGLLRGLYRRYKDDVRYTVYLNSAALLVYGSSNFNIVPQVDRILFSYEIILILAVPYMLKRIENSYLRTLAAFAVVAGFALVAYNNVVVCHSHGVLPYRFVFNPSLHII